MLGARGGPLFWLSIPQGQTQSPDHTGVLRSSTALAPRGQLIMPVKLGGLAENDSTSCVELKAKARMGTGCTEITLQGGKSSSGLRAECGWDQEWKSNVKKLEMGKGLWRESGGQHQSHTHGQNARKDLQVGVRGSVGLSLGSPSSLWVILSSQSFLPGERVVWCHDVRGPTSLTPLSPAFPE